jgi:hypothetical protein
LDEEEMRVCEFVLRKKEKNRSSRVRGPRCLHLPKVVTNAGPKSNGWSIFFFVNSNHLLYLHLPKVVTKAAANMWYAREKGLDPKFEQLVAFKIGLLPRMFYQPACFQFHELCRVL